MRRAVSGRKLQEASGSLDRPVVGGRSPPEPSFGPVCNDDQDQKPRSKLAAIVAPINIKATASGHVRLLKSL